MHLPWLYFSKPSPSLVQMMTLPPESPETKRVLSHDQLMTEIILLCAFKVLISSPVSPSYSMARVATAATTRVPSGVMLKATTSVLHFCSPDTEVVQRTGYDITDVINVLFYINGSLI